MKLILVLIISSSVYGWYNSCPTLRKGLNLQFGNCPTLHSVRTDKKHRNQLLRGFQLQLNENGDKLRLQFKEDEWKIADFRISPYNTNGSNTNQSIQSVCGVITNHNATPFWEFNCLGISDVNYGNSYQFDYMIKGDLDEISKKIVFFVPKYTQKPLEMREIFASVDFTDTTILILKIQPLPHIYHITTYKIEVWRDQTGFSTLQDTRMISHIPNHNENPLIFEYHTYNEEGSYYFLISAITNDDGKCAEDFCLKSPTPRIVIEKKNTPLVIGIVCASLILPFVMFIIHYLTKKLKLLDGSSTGKKILIVYQSSNVKHNAALLSFGRFLETTTAIEVNYDEIPRFKDNNLERLCSDTLVLASDVLYVSPPLGDEIQQIDFSRREVACKRIRVVVFQHCANTNVPAILSDYPQFNIPSEMDTFLSEFGEFDDYKDDREYKVFLDKLEMIEKNNEKSTDVPVIIVTDPEPRENDKLLPNEEEEGEEESET